MRITFVACLTLLACLWRRAHHLIAGQRSR